MAVATRACHVVALKLLMTRGVNINEPLNVKGRTALMIMASMIQPQPEAREVLELLLGHPDIDVFRTDVLGKSALDWARLVNNVDASEAIESKIEAVIRTERDVRAREENQARDRAWGKCHVECQEALTEALVAQDRKRCLAICRANRISYAMYLESVLSSDKVGDGHQRSDDDDPVSFYESSRGIMDEYEYC